MLRSRETYFEIEKSKLLYNIARVLELKSMR